MWRYLVPILILSINTALAAEIKELLVTDKNRTEPGAMFGGWGHHLGRLLRSSDGTLWYVHDTGKDVHHNPSIAYNKFNDDQWQLVAHLAHQTGIQQNVGSIIDKDDVILSYGINRKSYVIEECRFDIKTQKGSCKNLLKAVKGSNYIGVAITPGGQPMVWWTLTEGKNGQFYYTYKISDKEWRKPITSSLGGYNNASYIHIAFKSDNSFVMLAQLLLGGSKFNWDSVAAVAEGTLGEAISPKAWTVLSSYQSTPTRSSDDIWVDPKTGDIHILALTRKEKVGLDFASGSASYYYKAAGGNVSSVLYNIPDVFRARFVSNEDHLYLVFGVKNEGIKYQKISQHQISGPISWQQLPIHTFVNSKGSKTITGIWPESSIYQVTPVKKMNIAYSGEYNEKDLKKNKDHEIRHIEIK